MTSENKYDFNDRNIFREMVGWFDVTVLLDAAKRSVVSLLFGTYADRRLTRAAHDDISLLKSGAHHRTDFRENLGTLQQEELWLDYVSDLGDGFNSTYSIAYLIGQENLKFRDELTLPRAKVLVMGGDEVYPTPTRYDYKTRLCDLYNYSYPDTELQTENSKEKKPHPLLFMIPGNHDWYDGLRLFLAKFCRGLGDSFANWRLYQTRSYFAARITNNWWILGTDTQLEEDIDQSQAEYFTDVTGLMEQAYKETGQEQRVILCTSVPTWVKADDEEESCRSAFATGVDYVATKIIKEKSPSTRIYTVLSGDQHHYSRYINEEADIHFITAGGGGAFLHPTHHLKDEVKNINWRKKTMPLKLAEKNSSRVQREGEKDTKACFPDRNISRQMAWGNLKFPWVNRQFVFTLGGIYALLASLLYIGIPVDSTRSYMADLLPSPFCWSVLSLLFGGLYLQTDFSQRSNWASKVCKKISFISDRAVAAFCHSVVHFVLLTSLYFLFRIFNSWFLDMHFSASWMFIIFTLEMVFVGGFLGGFIWGCYLAISSFFFGRHYNDAFSAMKLATYKNFLRMHIKDDELTIVT